MKLYAILAEFVRKHLVEKSEHLSGPNVSWQIRQLREHIYIAHAVNPHLTGIGSNEDGVDAVVDQGGVTLERTSNIAMRRLGVLLVSLQRFDVLRGVLKLREEYCHASCYKLLGVGR